jgi:hypothetical protein
MNARERAYARAAQAMVGVTAGLAPNEALDVLYALEKLVASAQAKARDRAALQHDPVDCVLCERAGYVPGKNIIDRRGVPGVIVAVNDECVTYVTDEEYVWDRELEDRPFEIKTLTV